MSEKAVTVAELMGMVGSEIGVSEWFAISQDRIDAFADATLDHQFIHTDPIQGRRQVTLRGAHRPRRPAALASALSRPCAPAMSWDSFNAKRRG